MKKRVIIFIAMAIFFGKAIAVEVEYPNIIISEVLPAPDKDFQQIEYIELFNPTEDNYTLNNWSIVDLKGDSYSLSGFIINANDYLVLGGDDFNITLNDNDEKIALVNPSNSIADSIGWESSTKGYSWSLLNNNTWSVATITPNKDNSEASLLKSNNSSDYSSKKQVTNSGVINEMQVKLAQENASSSTKKNVASSSSSKSTNPKNSTNNAQDNINTTIDKQSGAGVDSDTDNITNNNSIVMWIIVGSLFILYIAYEFRKELLFYYHKFRGKSETGGESLTVTKNPSYYIVGQ